MLWSHICMAQKQPVMEMVFPVGALVPLHQLPECRGPVAASYLGNQDFSLLSKEGWYLHSPWGCSLSCAAPTVHFYCPRRRRAWTHLTFPLQQDLQGFFTRILQLWSYCTAALPNSVIDRFGHDLPSAAIAETLSKEGRGRGIIWQPELAQLGGAFRKQELGSMAGSPGQGQECECLTLLNCPPVAERWEPFIKHDFPFPIRLQFLRW